MNEKYSEIINMPHYQSKERSHMSNSDRAAQFAPFAALTGYGDAVNETARYTENQAELDESFLNELNEKLKYLSDNIAKGIQAKITYFLPDTKKSGGKYVTVKAKMKKIDEIEKILYLDNGIKIPIYSIFDISS